MISTRPTARPSRFYNNGKSFKKKVAAPPTIAVNDKSVPQTGRVEVSYFKDFVANVVNADDLRNIGFFKMAEHSLPNVSGKIVKRGSLCKNGFSESSRVVAAFLRVFDKKNKFVHIFSRFHDDEISGICLSFAKMNTKMLTIQSADSRPIVNSSRVKDPL